MRSAKGTYDYKFIDAQKENLSNIQKQLVEEKDQVVYVYDIDNKLEYEFRNSIKFKRHFNIEESYQIKTQEYTRTKSGVAITKERFLISDSKEDLERQIKIFKDLKIDSHTNQGQFGKKNILAYNYILDKYFEFDSLSEMSRRTGKTISRISGILNRSSRSDDGWIIAQTKEHLERIKVRKNPSTKVKERYAKLEVIVSD